MTTRPDVLAMVDGIVASGSAVDFLATSSYAAFLGAAAGVVGYEPAQVAEDALALAALAARHPGALGGVPRFAHE